MYVVLYCWRCKEGWYLFAGNAHIPGKKTKVRKIFILTHFNLHHSSKELGWGPPVMALAWHASAFIHIASPSRFPYSYCYSTVKEDYEPVVRGGLHCRASV